MCCLVEKEIPQKSRRAYSGGFFQSYDPKKLQKTAKEYFSKTLPGIVHGKFEVGEYFVIRGKRAVLVSTPDIAGEFQTLAREWRKETGHYSLVQQKIIHPAYLQIIGMGQKALPFLINEIQQGSSHWFPALRAIAGNDRPRDEGATFHDAVETWTRWWNSGRYRYAGMAFDR